MYLNEEKALHKFKKNPIPTEKTTDFHARILKWLKKFSKVAISGKSDLSNMDNLYLFALRLGKKLEKKKWFQERYLHPVGKNTHKTKKQSYSFLYSWNCDLDCTKPVNKVPGDKKARNIFSLLSGPAF